MSGDDHFIRPDNDELATVWSRESAKANAIDFLEMTALVFQTEGKDGNARAARAVAQLIRTDFAQPKDGAMPVFVRGNSMDVKD